MAEVGVLLHGNMAEGKDTVWIGFMDIVPVIGAVKESVELVLALYEGNKEVIKEKEKALENFVKTPFQKHVKVRYISITNIQQLLSNSSNILNCIFNQKEF